MERPTFQKAIYSAKSHAREAVGGLVLLTLAAVACKSGQAGEVKTTPTQPANSPVATETIAPTPTAAPTEIPTVEPTSEPTPPPNIEELTGQVAEKISQGFDGATSIEPPPGYNLELTNLTSLTYALANCKEEGPITIYSLATGTTETVAADHPNFFSRLWNECLTVGEGTKVLYEKTQKAEFFEANQITKLIHESVFLAFKTKDSRLEDSFWTATVNRIYTLTPPPGYEK